MVTEKVFNVPNKPALDWHGVEKQTYGFCNGVLLFVVREPSHVDAFERVPKFVCHNIPKRSPEPCDSIVEGQFAAQSALDQMAGQKVTMKFAEMDTPPINQRRLAKLLKKIKEEPGYWAY